ncbi:hypothetical protein EVAR_82959_1 [Eumeta japonica]|uniref:Uncharacterized protein n=1 Tax=Eumeta variegata TaxID=151549 RepID=A0A4C1VS28_EUMVA|nr:hypothetical protein EVAR_82959_1 [Eumeta japonica]
MGIRILPTSEMIDPVFILSGPRHVLRQRGELKARAPRSDVEVAGWLTALHTTESDVMLSKNLHSWSADVVGVNNPHEPLTCDGVRPKTPVGIATGAVAYIGGVEGFAIDRRSRYNPSERRPALFTIEDNGSVSEPRSKFRVQTEPITRSLTHLPRIQPLQGEIRIDGKIDSEVESGIGLFGSESRLRMGLNWIN